VARNNDESEDAISYFPTSPITIPLKLLSSSFRPAPITEAKIVALSSSILILLPYQLFKQLEA
jgi:hypothetical protein